MTAQGVYCFAWSQSPVSSARHALPPAQLPADGAPLPTRTQLAEELAKVESTAKELGFLPAEGGGPLTLAVAKLAAKLKVRILGWGDVVSKTSIDRKE